MLLAPFAWLYGTVAARRMLRRKTDIAVLPVICIGNFTVGGAGKTPTALAMARAARERGLAPGFLSRGYGGTIETATIVDPGRHMADETGDEPLLLAREAVTVVSRRRIDGIGLLKRAGADLVIMDDGFQSASFGLDQAIVVVDARRGIGNGCIFPAGPLRAPLDVQIGAAAAVLVAGEGDAAEAVVRQASRAGTSVYRAAVRPLAGQDMTGQRVLAFAGIADPEKFFATVEALGADIALKRPFGDHHPFSAADIESLLETALRKNLVLCTTSKDIARLSGQAGRAAELVAASRVIEIGMIFEDPAIPGLIIDAAMGSFRLRNPPGRGS